MPDAAVTAGSARTSARGARRVSPRETRRPPATYPFTAIVGMDDLKLGLLLNAVSPSIGGVLVRGEKGTAKSTVVRGLAELLPPIAVVDGCRFACDPQSPDPGCPDGPHPLGAKARHRAAHLAELPVGATEDRLVGSLDIERALTEGVTAYEPGLLASAHRGVLYVDEVNLLHDHLVDLLLDAAALGTSYVEREGISVAHAARFLLVGTMNPEEGELRPQLLDRFGLTVQVTASRDPAARADVVRRRLAYEADPPAFAACWASDTERLARRISESRARLGQVRLPDPVLRQICAVCGDFGVDGLRADLVTARTAVALAAWDGRDEVRMDDVKRAARLALPHRRRRDPFDAPGLDEEALDEALRKAAAEHESPDDDPGGGGGSSKVSSTAPPATQTSTGSPASSTQATSQAATSQEAAASPEPAEPAEPADSAEPAGSAGRDDQARAHHPTGPAPSGVVTEAGVPFRPPVFTIPGVGSGAPGRRSAARIAQGRLTGARVPRGRLASVHLPATLRAAAPHQRARGWQPSAGASRVLRLAPPDLRESVRQGREGNLVLFAVDASGSMAARQRMKAVKGAVLSLLLDAYQRRDKVGMISFRGDAADLVLPPTSSVEAAARRLADLPAGGRTPLAAGLLRASEVLAAERLRDPSRRPLLVVVTDGRATSGEPGAVTRAAARLRGVASVVVDCESGPVRLGLASGLATALGGALLRLDELAAAPLVRTVRETRAQRWSAA